MAVIVELLERERPGTKLLAFCGHGDLLSDEHAPSRGEFKENPGMVHAIHIHSVLTQHTASRVTKAQPAMHEAVHIGVDGVELDHERT